MITAPSENTRATGDATVQYELLGRLGRGGMATVHLAKRSLANGVERLFAIKRLHSHLAEDDEYVQMFLDEARLASQLNDRNIISVLEVGRDQGVPFVVMEYVEGAPLSTLLRVHDGPLPPDIAVSITLDLLSALAKAHGATDAQGEPLHIIHRDVAPANVIVGVDGIARLTDFGIAKAAARITDTQTGVRKGRLDFMAPEQLTDLEEITQGADLFAAGAFLWTALVGRSLFRGEHEGQTIQKLLYGEIKPPSKVHHSIPSELDGVVLRALERDVSLRYQTADEMADDLRAAALEARALASPPVVGAFVRRAVADTLEERRALIRGEMAPVPTTSGLYATNGPTTLPTLRRARRQSKVTAFVVATIALAATAGVAFGMWQWEPPRQLAPPPSAAIQSIPEPAPVRPPPVLEPVRRSEPALEPGEQAEVVVDEETVQEERLRRLRAAWRRAQRRDEAALPREDLTVSDSAGAEGESGPDQLGAGAEQLEAAPPSEHGEERPPAADEPALEANPYDAVGASIVDRGDADLDFDVRRDPQDTERRPIGLDPEVGLVKRDRHPLAAPLRRPGPDLDSAFDGAGSPVQSQLTSDPVSGSSADETNLGKAFSLEHLVASSGHDLGPIGKGQVS